MQCPECHNKGFEPTEDVKLPLHNLGGKQRYNTVDIRSYICNQCGYKFYTQELFYRAMTVPQQHAQTELTLKDVHQ